MEKTRIELKCKSYDKVVKLIKHILEEYVILEVKIERVFDKKEDYYKALIVYEEFPF